MAGVPAAETNTCSVPAAKAVYSTLKPGTVLYYMQQQCKNPDEYHENARSNPVDVLAELPRIEDLGASVSRGEFEEDGYD